MFMNENIVREKQERRARDYVLLHLMALRNYPVRNNPERNIPERNNPEHT